MATRRNAREWAISALCAFDLNPPEQIGPALVDFWHMMEDWERLSIEEQEHGACVILTAGDSDAQLAPMKAFAEERSYGVCDKKDELDKLIAPFLENWSLYRLGTIERNVLRMAVWEMRFAKDSVPVPVVINEAVDLAKYFSATASGRFVNGVLDKMKSCLTPSAETFTVG